MKKLSQSEELILLKSEVAILRTSLEKIQEVKLGQRQNDEASFTSGSRKGQKEPGIKGDPSLTRRKVLKGLAAGLVTAGGLAATTFPSPSVVEAKVDSRNGRVGAVITPVGDDVKNDLPTGTSYKYGLVALSGTGTLDLSNPANVYPNNAAIFARSNYAGVNSEGRTFGVYGRGTASGGTGVYGNGVVYGMWGQGPIGVFGDGRDTGVVAKGPVGLNASGTTGPGVIAASQSNSQLQLVPQTISGPPTSNTHARGEIWLDNQGDLYLCKTTGTPGTWQKVNNPPPSTHIDRFDNARTVNVKDFGAKGDGVTDDTAAIQAALNQFSRIEATQTEARTGSIYFPPGDYKITSTLRYIGNPGTGLRLYGDIERDRAGSGSGIWLLWAGAVDGTMFKFEGANGTTIEKINFNGQNRCKRVLWFDAYGYPSGFPFPFTGSSGLVMRACFIANSAGPGSSLVALGHEDGTGVQVSEVFFEECYFSGNGDPDPLKLTEAGFKTLSGGNTKNFFFYGCLFGSCLYNVDCIKDSGPLMMYGGVANSTTGITFRLGDGGATLDGVEAESINCIFLTSATGAGNSSVIIRNCDVSSDCNADDKFIDCGTTLVLEGNKFANRRAAGSIPKIYCNSIHSLGNWFLNVTDHAPFYDGSGNNLLGGPGDTYYKIFTGTRDRSVLNVTSLNDRGNTPANGTAVRLRQTATTPVSVVQLQPTGMDEGAAMSGDEDNVQNSGFNALNIGEPRLSSQRITIDYRRWKTAATAFKVVQLFELPIHSKLLDLVADTTIPYTGTDGTLELRMSTDNPDGDELILAHDVKSGPVVRGNSEADLGPLLLSSNRAQGSYAGNWSSVTPIHVSLTSGSGNLSMLSAGSTTFYATFLRYP